MATTSISGEKGVRLASAVAARPAMPLSAASDGLERFSIPVEGPSSGAIPVSNGAAEPKAAIRDGAAAKPVATASLGSAIAQSALPISDLVRLAKATIPSSQPSTDSAAGQKADAAETGLPRAREDEDPATAAERGRPWRFPVAERAADQCCRQASSNAAARWQGRLADHRRRRTFARAGSSGAGPGRSAGSSLAAHCGKRSSVRLPGSDRKCLTFLDLASLDNGTGGRDRSGSGHRL